MIFVLRDPERICAQSIRFVKITDDIIGGHWVRVKKSQWSTVRHPDILLIFTPVSASFIKWEEPAAMKFGLYAQKGRVKRYRMRNPVLNVRFGNWVDGGSAFLSVI